MYRNLDAEMAKVKCSRGKLARKLGITPTTLSLKLNGKSELSLKEYRIIKYIVRSELPLEELFATEDEVSKE